MDNITRKARDYFQRKLTNIGIIIALIVMIVLFGVLNSSFLRFENIMNILRQVSITGIITTGMAIVIITGGIDLSVGSIAGLSAVIAAYLMQSNVPIVIAIVTSLAMGIISGIVVAFFVNSLDVPPFVVTLAMMTILRGIAFIITQGIAIYGFSDTFKFIGQGYLGPIPIPVIIVTIVFIFGYILLEKTTFGRHVYGVGGNEESARLSGVNPKKIKYISYSLLGGLSALSGIVLLARVNSGNPNLCTGYEMDVISGCILGGVSISGGSGKITGVVFGVLILGVLSNGLIMLNINEFIQMVIKGVVLLAAVSFDKTAQKQRQKNAINNI